MDLAMYERPSQTVATATTENLHPDDAALLDWKGSMGDTAAEELSQRRDRARASARLALAGKPVPAMNMGAPQFQKKKGASRKDFSRVLDHGMVFFMKKTTYLSNDYSRKVHDFTSLAETKARTAAELQAKQKQLDRGSKNIEQTFEQVTNIRSKPLVHPSGNKKLKPVWDMPLLPNVEHWGRAYTHVVVDNPPKKVSTPESLEKAYIAHVEQANATARMTCQLLVPGEKEQEHKAIAHFDLDVVPLKESEEAAHSSFCIFLSGTEATYLPIPSRVQLSTGRPTKKQAITTISTKASNAADDDEDYMARMAQVDADVAAEHGGGGRTTAVAAGSKVDDAGFGQFDEDDDSDDE
jgi:RNA polymerase II-associated factor 1